MKTLLLIIVGGWFGISCPVSTFAGQNAWSQVGTTIPGNGRITCLTVLPSGAFLVGTIFGRTLLGQASGETWEDFAPTSDTVSIILVHPARSKEIYVGSLNGLWRTTDHGVTWEEILNQSIFSLAFDPITLSTIYAGTSEGIFKSLDNGKAWEQKSNGLETTDNVLPFIRSIVVNHLDSQTIYILASNSNRYQMPTYLTDNNEIPRTKNSRLGLFKTIDGGETWSRLESGLPEEDGSWIGSAPYNAPSTKSLTLSYTNPTVVYYADGLNFYRSIDAGIAFEKLEGPNTQASGISRGIDSFVSLPSDKPVLYSANNNIGFFRSNDLGITWIPMNNSFPNLGYMPSILTLASISPTELYAATVGKLWHYAVPSVDFSEDGKTDFEDFLFFANGFGKEKGDPEFEDRLDLNENGKVDFTDFLIFVEGYKMEN